jgi:hypothetical protein
VRTLTNTQAFTRGAIALSILAGWTPRIIGSVAALTIATSASAHDVAGDMARAADQIARIQSQLVAAEHTAACAASGAQPAHVSLRMAELIQAYEMANAKLGALDPRTHPDAWDAAEEAWYASEAALMNQRPANAADLAAKLDALLEVEASEGEFARIKRLSEDAHHLAGGAK